MLERVISVLAPHYCLNCGDEGKLLCAWCFPSAFQIVPARCYKCYRQSPDSRVCERCRRTSRLKHVWVATEYDGLAKDLIYAFKFERAQAGADIIAKAMRPQIPYLDNALIVPVPTATSRQRERGYDHTKLIAKHLSDLIKLECAQALVRTDQTRQVGSKRAKRLEQLARSFRVKSDQAISGRHILLVDDIVTSGATLEQAAKTLKEAGAKTIDAVVFAQSQ